MGKLKGDYFLLACLPLDLTCRALRLLISPEPPLAFVRLGKAHMGPSIMTKSRQHLWVMVLVYLVCGLSLFPDSLFAQPRSRRTYEEPAAQGNNLIKANVLSPFALTGSFFYERVLQERISAQLGFFFTGFRLPATRFGGFGITPEFRYYLVGDAPRGTYLAPYYRYQRFNARIRRLGELAQYSQNGGGLILGRQWIIVDLISLDAFLGAGYMAGQPRAINRSGQLEEVDVGPLGPGFKIRTGITAGFRF